MSDVHVWTLLLIGVGIFALVWLNRLDGHMLSRALKASVMAAFPGACFLIELSVFPNHSEPYGLLTFGPALVWVVVGFVALVRSFS
jgi:hypothetical protein